MRLYLKIFASVSGLLLAACLLLYGVSALLVRPRLQELEQHNIQQNTSRALDVVKSASNQVYASTLDWSYWDDTYHFVNDSNQAYIDANMTDSSIENLGASMVIITNARGQVVYSKNTSLNNDVNLPVPADVLAAFSNHSQLLSVTPKTEHRGLLALKSGPITFASEPILTSLKAGPVRGTLTFVLALDQTELGQMTEQTKLPMQMYSLSDKHLPSDVMAISSSLNDKTPVTRILSDSQAAGYQLIRDAYGRPALVMRVKLNREIFTSTSQSLNLYLLAAGLIALLLSLINGLTTSRLLRKQTTIALKDEFFSVASHELRTPLTAIRGNSQMAIDHYGHLDVDLAEMLEDVHSASVQLIKLVNNFLDAARLEDGRIPYNLEAIDAVALINQAVEELQFLDTQKSLVIRADLPSQLPPVYADKDRLKQVIINIVGNAVKFTDEGSITLTAKVIGKQIVISVTDTGRGMSPEGKKSLFSRFTQSKREDARSGSGLGLYISKLLIEDMGGRIWVESSKVGKGTTISFSLPKAK